MAEKHGFFKAATSLDCQAVVPPRVEEVDRSGLSYSPTLTMQSLVGAGAISDRARQQIYNQYQQRQFDPPVSGTMRLHVMAAPSM